MRSVMIMALVLSSLSTFAQTNFEKEALKFVPSGKVMYSKGRDVKVQTKNGSVIEVEFHADGSFEEASGDIVDKDDFEPGNDLLSLKAIREKMSKLGKTPSGEWSLEKSFLKGWHYELQGVEKGQMYEYLVDGEKGIVLDQKLDD